MSRTHFKTNLWGCTIVDELHKIIGMLIDFILVAADILSEFLEVAFHAILYVREIYPSSVFERRKKYDVPVQVSDKKIIDHDCYNCYIDNLSCTTA